MDPDRGLCLRLRARGEEGESVEVVVREGQYQGTILKAVEDLHHLLRPRDVIRVWAGPSAPGPAALDALNVDVLELDLSSSNRMLALLGDGKAKRHGLTKRKACQLLDLDPRLWNHLLTLLAVPLQRRELERQQPRPDRAAPGARAGPAPAPGPDRAERLAAAIAKRQRALYVVLEASYNMRNVAAAMRSCDAFGVTRVLLVNPVVEVRADELQVVIGLLLIAMGCLFGGGGRGGHPFACERACCPVSTVPPWSFPGGGGVTCSTQNFSLWLAVLLWQNHHPRVLPKAFQWKVVSMCKSSRSSGAGPRNFTPSQSRSRSPYIGSPLNASYAEFFRFMLQFLCLQMCVYGGSAVPQGVAGDRHLVTTPQGGPGDRLPWGGAGQGGGCVIWLQNIPLPTQCPNPNPVCPNLHLTKCSRRSAVGVGTMLGGDIARMTPIH